MKMKRLSAKKISELPRYRIGFGDFQQHRAALEVRDVSLLDLARFTRDSEPGAKAGVYFVRGEAEYRKDVNIINPVFIVIDGDASLKDPCRAPSPNKLHKFMKKAGINHLIYPSWSNGQRIEGREPQEGNERAVYKRKWRLVIPTIGLEGKEHTKLITAIVTKVLQDNGCNVVLAPESKVYSQPWYFTKPDRGPDHGWYLLYVRGRSLDCSVDFAGIDLETIQDPQEAQRLLPVNAYGCVDYGVSVTLDEALLNIQTGDNLHPSMRTILGAMNFNGVEKDEAFAAVKGDLEKFDVAGKRGSGRLKNIDEELEDIWRWVSRTDE